jgi:site-specific DNA-methyltransferase (adenine-specific)
MRFKKDAYDFISSIPVETVAAAFVDFQYRGVLDATKYGNEGKRQEKRAKLPQMDEEYIMACLENLEEVLKPSGHLFLWVDTYHLTMGDPAKWLPTGLPIVDLIVWDKQKFGMGYRSRRTLEYLVVAQKLPKRAKGVWKNHSIRDLWSEKVKTDLHPHRKPYGLIKTLIECVTEPNDLVIDPCAGSFVVHDACDHTGRQFIGNDIVYGEIESV